MGLGYISIVTFESMPMRKTSNPFNGRVKSMVQINIMRCL